MPVCRPYWKGYLKLSFVSCPIALYSAISAAERISFRRVNRRTGHPSNRNSSIPLLAKPDAADKARGYEVGENEFLLVEDRDLEQARRERPALGEAELAAPPRRESPPTVPASLHDEPASDPRCDEPRGRCRLCARGAGRAAVLRGVTLRFAHEVRNELEYFSEIPEMKLPPAMMKLAQHIIRTKSADFDSAMLEDHYRSASCASCAENRRNVPRRRLQSSRHARTSSTSWTLSGEASPPTARQSLPPERRDRPQEGGAGATAEPVDPR